MKYLGIDIGGANIKIADADGYAATSPFALWREPERLAEVLAACLGKAPPRMAIAATTTGELADCFSRKREGIAAIYGALAAAAVGRPVAVYLTDGRFVSTDEAIGAPQLAAASNWHALAAFAARYLSDGVGVLIDAGSTTTDIIPLIDGRPAAMGAADTQRLLHGELVYTGAMRTPVGMLVSAIPWRGSDCPVARELFATALDAHLILGNLPEDDIDVDTADGRPANRAAARDRLARMIGADRETFDEADAKAAAGAVAEAQCRLISEALKRVLDRPDLSKGEVLVSGSGEFLARAALRKLQVDATVVSLSERLGPRVSQAATARALATLADERYPQPAHWQPLAKRDAC